MRGGMGQQPPAQPQGITIQGRRYVSTDFYVYEEDFSGLAAGNTQNGAINIQADSDFVVEKLAYFADVAAAGQTESSRVVPLITVQITDTGSGRNFVENPAPIPSLFGDGRLPFVLPEPRLFFARSTVQIQVSNFDASQTYNLRLSFIGYKAYPLGQ